MIDKHFTKLSSLEKKYPPLNNQFTYATVCKYLSYYSFLVFVHNDRFIYLYTLSTNIHNNGPG